LNPGRFRCQPEQLLRTDPYPRSLAPKRITKDWLKLAIAWSVS